MGPRATKDIDLFVHGTPDNDANLMRALRRFGASLSDVSEKDFASEGIVFQIERVPMALSEFETKSREGDNTRLAESR